jgi:hypothetical protein
MDRHALLTDLLSFTEIALGHLFTNELFEIPQSCLIANADLKSLSIFITVDNIILNLYVWQ